MLCRCGRGDQVGSISSQLLSVHVLADIGGTNVRFAYVTEQSASLQCIETFACSEYERFEDAIQSYIKTLTQCVAVKPVKACLAIAACVQDDVITLTNSSWEFSRTALEISLGFPVHVLNDFTAQAYSLAQLSDEQVQWWQRGVSARSLALPATHTRSIVGPGTGFGGASLLPSGEILDSEPGHLSFAPVNEHELQILALLWKRFPRVSVEHLLSGPGLANLFWANAFLQGDESELHAAAIVARAEQGDPLCLKVIRDFTGILGSICGDIALANGSLSGLFLSGAMLKAMEGLFDQQLFLARFTNKGPFSHWCQQLPVGRVTLPYPGLLGCAEFSRRVHD